MARFPVRKAGLVGAVLAACVSPARADHHTPCPPGPGAPAAPAAPAPAFRTVLVTECVPETYQARRVSYRAETRVEKYTAHRCQLVPEVRDQVVTTYKHVPEVRTVVRRVCVNVPTVEERTVIAPRSAMSGQAMLPVAARVQAAGFWRRVAAGAIDLTLLVTVFLPEYWLHPYGPILKNLPMMAGIALLWALEPPRR